MKNIIGLETGGVKMELIMQLRNLISMGVLEVLIVTACLSTIIFIVTKNQYISYLSSAPIFFIFSWMVNGFIHFIFLIFSMSIQAGIVLLMNRQSNKKLELNLPKQESGRG